MTTSVLEFCVEHWHLPLSLYPAKMLRGYTGYLTSCCRALGVARPRVRTWQRCAWLAGVRPTVTTTLQHIHGELDTDCRLAAFAEFCEVHFASSVPCYQSQRKASLYSLRSPFRLTTWNVTSLRSHREGLNKLSRLRRLAACGLVLLQETHLLANDPLPIEVSLAHCDLIHSRASRTDKGGTSGGLLFIIPEHLGYKRAGSIHEILPGYLAWVLVSYSNLRFRCWNVHAVPHRRKEILQALRDECQRLSNDADDVDDAVLDVFAGDLNTSPLREADASTWTVASAALRARLACFAPLADAAQQGSYRDVHGPHWIDHAGATAAADGSSYLRWHLSREQPTTISGHHSPLTLTGSLQSRRSVAKNRFPPLPTWLFLGRGEAHDNLVVQLTKCLTDGGLPLDVIRAKRRAFTDSAGQQGAHSLLQTAQDLADECCVRESPLKFFAHMEVHVHNWARRELRRNRKTPVQVLTEIVGTGTAARILVPADAWRTIHRSLEMPAPGRQEGDCYDLKRGEVQMAIDAYRTLMHDADASSRHATAPHSDQHTHFRKLFPKVSAFDERLETDVGLTDDPVELDRLYMQSRDFWYRAPECDPAAQVRHLHHYLRYVVREAEIDVPLPSLSDIHHIVVNTPDSSPGYRGVPFAAWRLISLGVAMLLRCFFRELLRDAAAVLDESPLRHQLTKWIPKKVSERRASARRPLGISASFYRLVNAVLHMVLSRHLQPKLHPSQALFRSQGGALTAAEHMQDYLDTGSSTPYATTQGIDEEASLSAVRLVVPFLRENVRPAQCENALRTVSLSDFNKAFERVSPGWIMMVLCAWGVPNWLAALAAMFLYDRLVHLFVSGWVGPGRRVHTGVDMGGNASSTMYCLGIDPLLWLLPLLPDVQQVEAFMDDLAAAGGLCGAAWFQAALQCFESSVPFAIDYHACWRVDDGAGWCLSGTPFQGLDPHCVRTRRVRAPDGSVFSGTWSELGRLELPVDSACECRCKLRIVPHRRPTTAEYAALLRLPWGSACVSEQADYLGVVLTARLLWSIPQPIDIGVHRAQLSFAKPVQRIAERVERLQGVKFSFGQRCVAWIVYILPLVSYVAQYCWLYTAVAPQLTRLMMKHMRCQWWLSSVHLQCLRVWTGKADAPQCLAAVCAGHFLGRWCRTRREQWWHSLHRSSAGAIVCQELLECVRWTEDSRCSREARRVLSGLEQCAAEVPWGKVGAAFRMAMDEKHAAHHEGAWQQKFTRWPISMQAPMTCWSYRHPRHSFGQILTVTRWLVNAAPTGRRRRHWITSDLRQLQCEVCAGTSNVIPVTKSGSAGICYDHLMELAVAHFDGRGWQAYVHLASIVADAAHQDVQELTPVIGTQHPVTEQFRDQSWHERPATVASSCVACGFSDDSLEHRLFACPVVGQVWETIFSDTGPTWTARAAPATALLAFYHSVHLWFVARSHVDGSLVDSSPAVWQRNVRSMLQAWWDGLASVDKTWEVAGRLLQQGVRLSSVHIPSGVGVEHGTLSHCELCALAAVSRNGLAVTIVVRRKAGCVVAPCDECSRFWECGSVHCVVPVRVGPGLVAPAGCPDYRRQRWAVATRTNSGSTIYRWLSHSEAGCHHSHQRPALVPRTVRLGDDYNVRVQTTACACGWMRSTATAVVDLAAGTELVALHKASWDPARSQLVLTCDGGGKWVDDRPCFGAGLVAFVYYEGAARRLADLALPLYDAESAQEAEAAGAWEAVMWRTHALRIAHEQGFEPSPPDVLYGDSANTAGAMEGRVRLRAPAPNRWFAGMREVAAAQTRAWLIIDVPRSMNKAADKVATIAWHLVRDVRDAGPRLSLAGRPALEATNGISLSTTYSWTQVLVAFGQQCTTAQDIERRPWRLRLAEQLSRPGYCRPFPSTLDQALPQLEWAAQRPDWSHMALYYALVFMPGHGNRTGQRYYRAWKLQQAFDLSQRDVASGWVFVWLATPDATGQGRAQELTPGVQLMPRPLRALLLGAWHREHDLASCHLTALGCVLTAEEAPELHRVLVQLSPTSETREAFLREVPGGKRSLIVPLNCQDLVGDTGDVQRWIRAQGRVPPWYIAYIEELHRIIPIAMSRLEMQGYTGLEGQTGRNYVYHHTAQVEARVVRWVLHELRKAWPLFSHALVHDALMVENTIPVSDVMAAFAKVTEVLGLSDLHVAEKPWTADLRIARSNLQATQYSGDAPIPRDSLDLYDEAQTLHRYSARALFDVQRRVPRG